MVTPLRVGNASGFYGDRFGAMAEMLTDGPLDVLTGDYLAELTMLILGRDRMKDPDTGYAKTFLRQMETCLGLALDRGVKIVVNAGGLNPAGLASALRDLATRLGLAPRIGYVSGDDLLPRVTELGLATDRGTPLTANAYLGGWGIAACLEEGANVVVTGRVTDASLVVGPAAAHFGWARDDFDALAGAVVAGHILECGAQATGGNYSFFRGVDLRHPGFPLAEIHADGSCVITKHPDTGGEVTVGTVTAQLLYEIDGPRYLGPDVVARFDTIQLSQEDTDRVRVNGVRGEAPPTTVKVCLNHLAGFRNDVTFILTGLDIAAKAELVEEQLSQVDGAQLTFDLWRTDHEDAATEAEASALLRVTARSFDKDRVGRAFSSAAVELALASYPGFTLTAPPGDASPYAVYEAGFVPQDAVQHMAVLPSGELREIPPTTAATALSVVIGEQPAPLSFGDTRRAPLGLVAGARSGDKGGTCNVGVWASTDPAWRWLAHALTVDLFRELLPEAAPLKVTRHVLGNLRALNFVVEGLLGEGVAANTRFDPQGKGVGEWLRSRHVDIPLELL